MPLIIIAIVLLIGLLVYAIIRYRTLDGDETPVKDRYPEKFARPNRNGFGQSDAETASDDSDEKKTLLFPTENIETEKHKRNIH